MDTPDESMQPPIVSRPRHLPLHGLGWEEFEDFCCDLIAHQEQVATCQRHGKSGDAQEGIDLLAFRNDGTHWAIQCKRHEKFTAALARKALADMRFEASKYLLLLSTEATASVRNVFLREASAEWELWDVHDISSRVRALPDPVARRLVERYFGAVWRKEFLDQSGLECFRRSDDYFGEQLNTQLLFHQAWPLVGRKSALEKLDSLLSPGSRVGLLMGRGGIGKTKLLYEWSRRLAERSPDEQLFFVDSGVPLDREAADELPLGPCILVLDDAQNASTRDLEMLLAIARQRQQTTRVLLSCRPHTDKGNRSPTQAAFES